MYEDIFASIRQAAEKRNLRERAIQLYCSDASYFLRCTNKPITGLTLEDADAFLTQKRQEGRSPEPHNHYGSSIKFLCKRAVRRSLGYAARLAPRKAADYERHMHRPGYFQNQLYSEKMQRKRISTHCINMQGKSDLDIVYLMLYNRRNLSMKVRQPIIFLIRIYLIRGRIAGPEALG